MTRYCVQFFARHWCVRPELFARNEVCTYYLRACKVADYLNLRLSRLARASAVD